MTMANTGVTAVPRVRGLRPLAGFVPGGLPPCPPLGAGCGGARRAGANPAHPAPPPLTPGAPLQRWLQPFIHAYGRMGHHEGHVRALVMTVCQDRLEKPGLEGCLTRHAIVWPYTRRLSTIVPS
jgi:hypothetical protein